MAVPPCETYFRRTYKGTTEELIKVIQDGLKGGKLPALQRERRTGLRAAD